jgi:hypothetical protein
LRPAPREAIPAHEVELLVGRTLHSDLMAGQEICWTDVSAAI